MIRMSITMNTCSGRKIIGFWALKMRSNYTIVCYDEGLCRKSQFVGQFQHGAGGFESSFSSTTLYPDAHYTLSG